MSQEPEPHSAPTTGRLLKFTGWNLFGLCAPMAVAFFALPPLRGRMGEDIYGAFMFLLTVINYLSILDLGLGRAVTQSMSARIASRKIEELPAIFWTAMGMMLAFALVGMAVFFPLIPSIVCKWSRIPAGLQADAAYTLFAAGLGTPFLVLAACLVGVLEAHQKFKLINIIRLPMQTYTFLGPLAVALMSHSLLAPVVALLAGKAVECVIYFGACLWDVPVLRQGICFQKKLVKQLFVLGGWMSVSSIAMLVLNQMNSAMMFTLLPVAMVGFYATIAEMVIRLLIFPRAWVSVLFPSFSAQHAMDSGTLAGLYAKGVKSLLVFSFPVILVLFAFAGEALTIWQDAAFSEASAGVMRWLVAGIFIYSISFVPFSLLQGVGRPDISAKLHLIEIPFAIVLAWVLMKQYGMQGAGIAWFIRCLLETSIMALLANRYARGSSSVILRTAGMMGLALIFMAVMALIPSLWLRLAVYPAEVLAFLVLSWHWLMTDDERVAMMGLVKKMLGRKVALNKFRFILLTLVVSMTVYFTVTWPLGAEFHAGIPSSNRPEAGGARYMIPGDHLQYLYQLWMLADSFTGGTPLFYHVYEFNQGNDQALYNPGSYYFPFGLLYSAGYAVGGRVVGWNLMLCVTVWLIYLSTWLLVRRFSKSDLTAAVAALPSILLPYFYVSLLGGSPTGMGVLWVPLIFLGVDVAIRDQKMWGGVLAGILLFICSWVDLHVFFFVFLATPVWALMCVVMSRPGLLARLKASYWPIVLILAGMIGAYLQTSLIKSSLDDTLQSKGRTLNESLGYALRANGWFTWALDNRDNIIYVGIVVGAILLIGWILLGWDWLRNRTASLSSPFLTLTMFLLAIIGIMILALGPNTPFDPNHHLWKALRAVIPPYRMIRQPAKIFCLLTPFLGIALAMALDRMNGAGGKRVWRLVLAGVVTAGFMLDYGRRLEPTICLLDYEQGGYRAVADDAARCGRENRAMAIPLWPGDSHWNSITEYYATLYRTKMLNGYSPSVSRQYFTNVFLRFEAINMGLITDDILDGLLAMKIGYLVLHEDAFPPKVSPFPVSQTLAELRRHPRLQFLTKDKAVWAFKIIEPGQRRGADQQSADPLLTGWQWDACDVAGGSAVVVNDGTNIFMRLPAQGGRVQLDPRTLYPVEGLRYVASVRGEGRLVGSCGSGLTGDVFSVEVATGGAWTWLELPVPALPVGRQTFVAPVFTNLAGSVDISMLTIMGRDWQWLKPGESRLIPAKAFCYTAYSDPGTGQVQLDVDRVQAGCAFYAPVLPVLPGRYQVTLEYEAAAGAGTVLGAWSVLRSDGKGRVSVPVTVGRVATVEFLLDSPRPLRLEFEYNRAAAMSISAVRITRVDQ